MEEMINEHGEKISHRLRGIIKIGTLHGKRCLVEEGLDKNGNLIIRAVKGEIENPKCCSVQPI